MDGYQRLCDINKNAIKMGVIDYKGGLLYQTGMRVFKRVPEYQYLPGYTYNRHDNLRVYVPDNLPF